MSPTVERHSALSRFFRDDTGDVVVMQRPNLPIVVWFLASLARWVLHPDGAWRTALAVVGTGALVVWAVLEVVSGASPFRRVLGGVVLAGVVARLLL